VLQFIKILPSACRNDLQSPFFAFIATSLQSPHSAITTKRKNSPFAKNAVFVFIIVEENTLACVVETNTLVCTKPVGAICNRPKSTRFEIAEKPNLAKKPAVAFSKSEAFGAIRY